MTGEGVVFVIPEVYNPIKGTRIHNPSTKGIKNSEENGRA